MSKFWKNQKPLIQPWLTAGQAAQGGGDGGGYLPGPKGTPVEFPRHLFPPPGVDTIDFRIERQMDAGEVFDLISFRPDEHGIQGTVYITQYAVFNDGLLEENFAFVPTLNGQRIYPFHGNPAFTPALISLGLAPDLGDEALINGFLTMNPQDRLKWTAYNKDSVSVAMGVRVVGYVDQTSQRTTVRYGG